MQVQAGTRFLESDPYGQHLCFRRREKKSFGTPGSKKASGFRKLNKRPSKTRHQHWLVQNQLYQPLFWRSRKKRQSVARRRDRPANCLPSMITLILQDSNTRNRAAAPAFRRREKAGAAAPRFQTPETRRIDQTLSKTGRRCGAHAEINPVQNLGGPPSSAGDKPLPRKPRARMTPRRARR